MMLMTTKKCWLSVTKSTSPRGPMTCISALARKGAMTTKKTCKSTETKQTYIHVAVWPGRSMPAQSAAICVPMKRMQSIGAKFMAVAASFMTSKAYEVLTLAPLAAWALSWLRNMWSTRYTVKYTTAKMRVQTVLDLTGVLPTDARTPVGSSMRRTPASVTARARYISAVATLHRVRQHLAIRKSCACSRTAKCGHRPELAAAPVPCIRNHSPRTKLAVWTQNAAVQQPMAPWSQGAGRLYSRGAPPVKVYARLLTAKNTTQSMGAK
mmetsp:Transcript_112507/g.317773  ORF Transcript_112507/g.317773 Transcript_112507/m.317773 type:complete len:267 (-) Transcript_112507:314-1114(-)